MPSIRRTVVAMVAAVSLALSLTVTAPGANAAPAQLTSEYIVTLDGSGPVGDLLAEVLGLVGAGEVLDTYEHALTGGLVRLPDVLAGPLALLPGVTGVERNDVFHLVDTQQDPPWGLDRIDQRHLPLDGTYTYDTTAPGVTAYIIDTGIRATHEDFGSRVQPGVNTADSAPSTEDCNGHGTHVAGTVGGATHGVAKDVTLVAVRVFGCADTTTTAAIIAGADWVAGDHSGGPAVANLSLGGGASTALDNAVRGMSDSGITTVVAAGNERSNACNSSPARVAEALTVGATGTNDARASFSNFGTCVDLHAPGVNVVSASSSSDTSTASLSGTSMASPHVAGAAALLLSDSNQSPAQVHAAIVDHSTTGVVGGIHTSCTILDNLLGTCTVGTPNRLLYTGTSDQGPPPPPPPGNCSILDRLLGAC